MTEVFITKTSTFLPNQPVSNSEMEMYLGQINGKPSKSKNIVLRSNGIETRYYALDKNGNPTHTNADLTANAIKSLFEQNPEELKTIDSLACGTTSPDQLLPSHAVMVHGLLPETKNIEAISFSGACCSGMHAMKYAFMAIKSGEKQKAVCAGSERVSSILKADKFEEEVQHLQALDQNPYIAFEKDFLRWMLSDGAGAFLLENKRNENGLSLRIDWIELYSFANQMETCMCMGADKTEDGSLKSYQHFSPAELARLSVMSFKQDTKLLSANIVEKGFSGVKAILDRRGISFEDIDFILPHMSSYFFQSKIYDNLKSNGIIFPYERWFTNLKTKGNVGAGSIYLMVDELFKGNRLKPGNRLLLVVPESARFSYAFCLLTVC